MSDGSSSGGAKTNDSLERRLAALSPAKRALLMKQAGLAPPAPPATEIPRADPTRPAPLSYGQELLWLVEQATAGSAAYNVHSGLRLRGTLSESALHRALDALVARHEVLRTRFPVVDGALVQIVDPQGRAEITTADFRDTPDAKRDEEARAWVRALARKPFDLTAELPFRVGLARIATDEWWLVLSRHHLVSDGWSQGVLYSDLSALYTAYASGSEPQLPPLQVQYRDFAAWQRTQLQGDRLEQLLTFWRGQLADASEPVSLPVDFTRSRTPTFEGRWISLKLPASVRDAVRSFGRDHNASVFVTMMSAFQVFIHRYAGARDVVVASPVAGRAQPELAPLIGYFGNTLLFRAQFGDDPTFRDVLSRGRETTMAAFDHQELPFERLVLDLPPERRSGVAPLFHAMFSFNTGIYAPPVFADLGVSAIGEGIGAAKTDLVITTAETDEGLNLAAEYRTDLFEHATVERLLANFAAMLSDAIARPDVPVSRLTVMTDGERRRLVHEWNDTDAAWPTTATLHGVFESQVAKRPNSVAVQCAGESLTYAELDRRANRVAWRLRDRGVVADELIAVCMEKSIGMVVTLLAILKAGGAYVPMDPSYPDDRLQFMLEDSAARIVVTDRELVPRLAALAVSQTVEPIVAADAWTGAGDDRDAAPPPRATFEHLCYVIYTSGSTGRPKGVLIEHRNVVRLLLNDRFQFQFSERDVWTVFHSFSFDFSVWEMYGALLFGGRLIVIPRLVAQEPAAFLSLLAAEGVTVLNQVPSAFYGLMQEELARPTATLGALRYVIFGGEALQPALLRDFKARYPATTLVNMFGITETTVHVTFKEIGAAEIENGASNIGGPIPTLTLYILDEHLQLVPIGTTGELCVGGAGVARGYLKRPELTAERFVAHPFRAGERMYRSGDLGRMHANGEIEYLGRRDAQVKIRGFRIELGEIENVLAAHPGVRQATIIAMDGRSDGAQLAGYYVPTAAATPQPLPPLTPASLRTYLRERLPEYMVPAFLVPLDAIPVTSNGKVDRAALPSPHTAAGEATSKYSPPRTVHEHQLVHIWKQLLDTRPIGIQDDFFDLGGHSLLAVRMLAEIEQLSGRRIPLATLFEGATIERLARIIESAVFSDAEPPVVVLPSGPEAQPFAFLHGDIRGGGWYCRRLAQLLGPKVKLVVLPTIRPGESNAPRTIEAMAAFQLTELRKVQPAGPYRLGGFCLGGVIAFEMAQQLRDAGEEVEHLILVGSGLANPPYPGLRWLIDAVLPTSTDLDVLERRALWLGRVNRARRMSTAQRLRAVGRKAGRLLSRATRSSANGMARSAAKGEIFTRPATDVIDLWKHVSGAYVPRPYPAPIDLVVGVERSEASDVDVIASMSTDVVSQPAAVGQRGFGRVSTRVRIHPVQASFMEVITTRLDALADHFRACLELDGPRATQRRE